MNTRTSIISGATSGVGLALAEAALLDDSTIEAGAEYKIRIYGGHPSD